ncbi:MAG: peptidase domain-containing ABC transporter [Niabella sp.]
MRFKFQHQLESNDCGPACLVMVAGFYKLSYSLKSAKELCAVTRMGVSVKDILEGGRKMGFDANGLKLTTNELQEIPLPAILFWKQDHFVVLYKIVLKKGRYFFYLADPGYGKITLEKDFFEKEWLGNNAKGVALVFQPADLKTVESRKPLRFRFFSGIFIKNVTSFLGSNKLKYIISILLLLVGLTCNWAVPFIFKSMIDNGIMKEAMNVVFILLLAQFVLFISNVGSQLFSDLILTKLNFKLSILLKDAFLQKLIKLPVNYFDTRLNTDTLQRLSDLSKVQTFLTWKGISFFINMLNLVVFSSILFFLNKLMFLIFFISSALSIIWVGYFLKRRATLEYSKFIQQSENNNIVYEFIMNMPEIKVNNAQTTLIGRITSLQKKLNSLELRSLFLNMYQLSGANFVFKLRELLIIALCAYLIVNKHMTLGTLLSVSYIMGQLSGPIMSLINNIRDSQDADISNKRVEEVYTLADESCGCGFKENDIHIGNLVLEKVFFKYPGSFNPFVLNNISFSIPKNRVTAIVGASGSGKTTLMKLMLSYYSPTKGNIYLDETSLSSFIPDEWRKHCGVVLQDGYIFSGSISYNIALLKEDEIDYERLKRAIQIACIEEFINGLPMGLNTKVGNVGMQLSGGQKQRILIARAVYKDPSYVFFDEATSSLDANNERKIMDNLDFFFKGRTVLIIAHRLSTVRNADQIIVMENGQIIETGTHNELVTKKDKYFSLVKNQLELGN